MRLQDYLDQIATVPELSGRVVVGMPERIENITQSPFVWVTNVAQSGGDSPVTGPVRQKIEFRFELTIGARSLAEMVSIRDKIMAALINFQPTGDFAPMRFLSGKMEFADPGWTFWRDSYSTYYFITWNNIL